ncbi:DUF3800 domain-containing protein [Acinetobacter pittii]|uniref:DUF3800 domain-containing protein n=1 Tax=Acinetobacter pittii TaxID=48296 RepID=UPI0002F0C8E3|nr:DUF3800 domain-containing protein [Acinetobacter pittii]MDX8274099.1 DUF3800 domain-containing protein [Acinetobacter pittii]
MSIYNIYCDESCHLPNDRQSIMTLGLIWCPLNKTREIATRIREIKSRHGLSKDFEIKWTKVSPAKYMFYKDIVDYFFDDDDIHFRGVIIKKADINHAAFNQTHDSWYYKMMFTLIEPVLKPEEKFRVYLDKKDTQSSQKVKKLHDVLCNNLYDFDRNIVERVQVIESHHVEQLQLADLLLGALGYLNRKLSENSAKVELIERIKQRSGYELTRSTLLRESKFNIFHWQGR